MNKKAIIALLSALVLTVVASVTLILTVGQKASADTEIVTVPVEYLKIETNVLKGFTVDGKTWIEGKQYRVEIPDTVTSIGDSAFDGCSGLKNIEIPSSVTSIGGSAFFKCSGLTSITIPSSVTSIGYSVFYNCSGLTSITVDPNNTKYTSQDNNGNECKCIIQKSNNTLIYGCQNTTIPSGVTSISDSAFSDRSGLTSITIPSSVTSIGDYAFYNCSGLTSITIPSSVTSIGSGAFQGCSRLTNITVGNPALLDRSALSSYKDKGYVHCRLTVTFANGSSVDTETVDYENTVIAPSDPIREGYAFNGWLLNGQPYDFNTPVTDNITLAATWEEKDPCTVTFDSNNGSTVDSQTVDYNTVISAPVTRRTGYTFKGWYNGETAYDFNTPVTDNLTLTAQWEAIPEPEPTEPEQPEPSNPEPTEPEVTNPETPTEKENTEVKENKKNGAVVAAVAGTSGVAGVTAIGTIVGVVLKKRRK